MITKTDLERLGPGMVVISSCRTPLFIDSKPYQDPNPGSNWIMVDVTFYGMLGMKRGSWVLGCIADELCLGAWPMYELVTTEEWHRRCEEWLKDFKFRIVSHRECQDTHESHH